MRYHKNAKDIFMMPHLFKISGIKKRSIFDTRLMAYFPRCGTLLYWDCHASLATLRVCLCLQISSLDQNQSEMMGRMIVADM